MAKFKKGDRVRNTEEDLFLDVGDIGTVQEESDTPFVLWDGKHWAECNGPYAQLECFLELV